VLCGGCGGGEGGCRAPAADVPERNLLVVALDGADWDIIAPLAGRGLLPNLEGLAREGSRARLRTLTPILSPVVWTSVATGKGPA
jgi:predicted AlkP superfamily phosphohydrolase/phosphomutase